MKVGGLSKTWERVQRGPWTSPGLWVEVGNGL